MDSGWLLGKADAVSFKGEAPGGSLMLQLVGPTLRIPWTAEIEVNELLSQNHKK